MILDSFSFLVFCRLLREKCGIFVDWKREEKLLDMSRF
jgi:hypothetical protein